MKKTIKLGAVLFSLLLWSCGGDSSPTASTPTPTPVATSITLSTTSLSFASLGATSQLSATCSVPRFVRQFGLAFGTCHEHGGAVLLG